MKFVCMVLLVLSGLADTTIVHGQVAAYAEFSAAYLPDGPKGDFLYGGTVGVLVDGPIFLKRILVSGDVDGEFVDRSGEQFDGVSVGPRLALKPVFYKLAPFAGFDVGFARFHDSVGGQSTDSIYGGRAGVTRRLSPRLDTVVEYRYERFPYSSNLYHPQSLSGGVVYHFVKR